MMNCASARKGLSIGRRRALNEAFSLRVRHRPDTRTRHQFRVLREHAGRVTRCGWLPPRTPLRQLAVADVELEYAPFGVDRNGVLVFDERDGAADRRLGRDVPDHVTVGPA